MATTTKEDAYKLEVFLPPSHELGRRQIVNLEAPAGCAACVWVANGRQSLIPSPRKYGRGFVNPVGIVAKGFVKDGSFPDGAIHLDGEIGPMKGKHVGFHRNEQVRVRVCKLGQDGLDANDHNIGLVGDGTGCADDMFKCGAIHTP